MPEEKRAAHTPRQRKGRAESQTSAKIQKKKVNAVPLPSSVTAILQELRVPWLLQKTDWLLHDKLKLLPDARTGRRLNFLWMLVASWAVMNGDKYLISGNAASMFNGMRNHGAKFNSCLFAFLVLLDVILIVFPSFLIQKNREIYLDFFALLELLCVSADKLTRCWRAGCCFGVPCSWGVYNDTLQTTVFPVQLFEFAIGMLCAVFCVLFMLYAKSYRPGRACSFCILSYFIPRFFWDFLRYHGKAYRSFETNWILGLNVIQVICIVGAVLGVVWLFLLPLEKRLMDRFLSFVARQLHKLAANVRFLSKWMAWYQSATKTNKEHTAR
jgi:prolipoprotein diacylglyceryltransferase